MSNRTAHWSYGCFLALGLIPPFFNICAEYDIDLAAILAWTALLPVGLVLAAAATTLALLAWREWPLLMLVGLVAMSIVAVSGDVMPIRVANATFLIANAAALVLPIRWFAFGAWRRRTSVAAPASDTAAPARARRMTGDRGARVA